MRKPVCKKNYETGQCRYKNAPNCIDCICTSFGTINPISGKPLNFIQQFFKIRSDIKKRNYLEKNDVEVNTSPNRIFELYPEAPPIVKDEKNYVVIFEPYRKENDHDIAWYTILYNPYNKFFVYVDTYRDICEVMDSFDKVKKFLPYYEIEKFKSL